MPTYARPRLTTFDDKRYRVHVEHFLLQRNNQRAIRPPRQRDLFGGEAEAALRTWLETQFTLTDRRILEYEERRNRRATIKYRELDALVLGNQSAWVFEIKASRTAGSLRRAAKQLSETCAILRLLYRDVHATVLLVDTGIPTANEVVALMATPEAPPRAPETLVEVLAALPDLHSISSLDERSHDDRVDLVRFTVVDIVALVGAENLSLDWEADEADSEPPPPAERFTTTSDASDDGDDNPLAAALRRAGLNQENERGNQ